VVRPDRLQRHESALLINRHRWNLERADGAVAGSTAPVIWVLAQIADRPIRRYCGSDGIYQYLGLRVTHAKQPPNEAR
jgi:hypothetical protein